VKDTGYGIFHIGDLSVYASDDTPEQKLTMENVVYGGKIASTVQLSPVQSTPHTGHSELPYQVLPEGVVMTDDRFAFPTDMSPQDMERRKWIMMLTGSVFTKFEPLYELGDGTPTFTFLVKQPSRVRLSVIWASSTHRSRWSTMSET
jgi:hypothetical protein